MSTLTRTSVEGPTLVKRTRPAKMLAIAGALVLAAAVGYAINSPETKPVGVAAVVPQLQTPAFLEQNTTAIGRPAARQQPDPFGPAFISANTDLGNGAASYTEPVRGPR